MSFSWPRRLGAYMTILGLVITASCKEGSKKGGVINPDPNPSITVAVAPTSLDLNQSATANVTVTITRTDFTGAVNVAVEGLPAGVTVPGITIAAGSTSGTLAFSATAAAAAATSALTVRATATGVQAVTASLTLNVKAVNVPTPAFALSLNPTTVNFQQGNGATVTVTITRSGGFTGAVALSATGLPAGVSAAFNPASATGNTSTLTLTSTGAAVVGTQNVSVRGTGTGVTEQNAPLSVQVTAAPAPPAGGNVSFTFCGSTGIPIFVAAQDDAGPWQRVTSTNTVYSFNIGTRGGIAYVVQMANGGFDIEIFYGTLAELQQQGQALCAAAGAGVTLNGTVAGTTPTDLLMIGMARNVGTAANNNTTFSIPGVPVGSFDLIAGRSLVSVGAGGVTFAPTRGFIRRNVNTGAAATIDFGGADAFDFITRNIQVQNLGDEVTRTLMVYMTANSWGGLYTDALTSAGATRTYFGVPAARQQASDFHYLNVIATPNTLAPTTTRQAGIAFNAAADKTVTLGPQLSAPTITGLGSGRARAVYTIQEQYNKLFNADFQQPGAAAPRRTSIQMTGAYVGGGTATIEIPVLTGVTGFDANWLLKAGETIWTFVATGWAGAGGPSTPIVEGGTYISATRMGTIGL